jgi:dolichol-phosphate mannosyltransferase
MVFIDDGSSDGSLDVLEDAARQDSRIMVISLSRNFGHQAAITAGLDYVTGDATVVMDGDLQDVPEAIPQFVECFREGFDVVYAQRIRRKESWALRLCYYAFYRIMARLSDVNLPFDAGDFGLMSRRVVDHLRRMPEHHRYLRGMRTWVGFKQVGISIERDARYAGKTKYSLMRLLRLASDGIFAFSIVPIRMTALLGAAAVIASSMYAFYAIFAKLFLNQSPKGFTALILMFTFLSGILLLFLGIIGEYVGRVYEETKGRPHYVVARIIGTSASDPISVSEAGRNSLGRTIR